MAILYTYKYQTITATPATASPVTVAITATTTATAAATAAVTAAGTAAVPTAAATAAGIAAVTEGSAAAGTAGTAGTAPVATPAGSGAAAIATAAPTKRLRAAAPANSKKLTEAALRRERKRAIKRLERALSPEMLAFVTGNLGPQQCYRRHLMRQFPYGGVSDHDPDGDNINPARCCSGKGCILRCTPTTAINQIGFSSTIDLTPPKTSEEKKAEISAKNTKKANDEALAKNLAAEAVREAREAAEAVAEAEAATAATEDGVEKQSPANPEAKRRSTTTYALFVSIVTAQAKADWSASNKKLSQQMLGALWHHSKPSLERVRIILMSSVFHAYIPKRVSLIKFILIYMSDAERGYRRMGEDERYGLQGDSHQDYTLKEADRRSREAEAARQAYTNSQRLYRIEGGEEHSHADQKD